MKKPEQHMQGATHSASRSVAREDQAALQERAMPKARPLPVYLLGAGMVSLCAALFGALPAKAQNAPPNATPGHVEGPPSAVVTPQSAGAPPRASTSRSDLVGETNALPPSNAAITAREQLEGGHYKTPVYSDRVGEGTARRPIPSLRETLPDRSGKAPATPNQNETHKDKASGNSTRETRELSPTHAAAPAQPEVTTPQAASAISATTSAGTETVETQAKTQAERKTASSAQPSAQETATAASPVVSSGAQTAKTAAPVAATGTAVTSEAEPKTSSVAVTPTTPASAPASTPAMNGVPAPAPQSAVQAGPKAATAPASTPLHTVERPSGPLAPVAEAIAARLAGQESLSLSKAEREALVQFYAQRGYQPAFVDMQGLNVRGKAIAARLRAAAEDGLNPDDYGFEPALSGAQAAALARTETSLAATALTYARHAQTGRFNPTRISELVTPTREFPEPSAILAHISQARDANAALAAYNPPHAGYLALKKLLGTPETDEPGRIVAIPPGPLLRPGKMDPRVPALRARLGLSDKAATDLTYDPELAEAVRTFQETMRLTPDGLVGNNTLQALNYGASDTPSRAEIIANMERWRWLPRQLGAHYVMVNIPEYKVRIHEGDKPIYETRTVVGKASSPTPLMTRNMTYAVVNPAWNIPPSIARNEMMPLLRNNPAALQRRNIEVRRNGSGGYSFRQMPGRGNSLGRVKFMFPNDHAVYLHDTPAKHLFSNRDRARSHGCVRVQDPFDFGSVLFNIAMPGQSWNEQRFTRMFSNKERYLTLKQPIPVHLVYFTTMADAQGHVSRFGDIYGINAAVKNRLGLNSRSRHMAEDTATRKR
ncbi:L,D-transpeptidase family protein [Xanthobacter sp. TB0139]|uniref:L,D-transpeptidase family protein n=1 Tax=Xanthobacter sp. TB0139 TaxID=3459178 RepID=UPI00403A2687